MSKTPVSNFAIKKINMQGLTDADDVLAVEEPLEVRLIYGPESERQTKSVSVTMRTPGNDDELAVGFLFTEGILTNKGQVKEVFNNPEDCNNREDNIVTVSLTEDTVIDFGKLERHFYTSSSCGVCGKASINSIRTITGAHQSGYQGFKVEKDVFHLLPGLLNQQQEVFQSTGGLHASALFSATGGFIALREDVGRHNALDKLIGAYFLNSATPLSEHILLLSGRASFELIQKAAMAGIKIVAAVGAPSSLAVELAREFGITLVGFLRDNRFNIYSGEQRVIA